MNRVTSCPKCNRIIPNGNAFCIYCGLAIADIEKNLSAPNSVAMEIKTPPIKVAPKVCVCGFTCDDPDLNFCPACGLSFAPSPEKSDASNWHCPSCNALNTDEVVFCTVCGTPKAATSISELEKKRWLCSACGAQNDADMSFCTCCGKPQKDKDLSLTSRPRWLCKGCNSENDENCDACNKCGKPKGWMPVTRTAERTIPKGMHAPSDEDLQMKSRLGN